MTTKSEFIDKVYKLTGNKQPLSFMLPSKSTKRFPLLYFDETTGQNRPLRYAVNQKSPFEDRQDGNFILEPIIFEKGMLFVPRTNQVLQEFMHYHPLNGTTFIEVNNEKDAEKDLERLDMEDEALLASKNLTIEQLEMIFRVWFGKDPSRYKTSEIKRDIRVQVRKDPKGFLNIIQDPSLDFSAQVRKFYSDKLLTLRDNKNVHFNLPGNKKRVFVLPFGQDLYEFTTDFLKTEEGEYVLKLLVSQEE
jgi:hypothetical protein